MTEGWAGNHDIAPTIAAWAGVEQQLKPDGIDLAASMNGAALEDRAFLGETTRFKTNRLSLLEGNTALNGILRKIVLSSSMLSPILLSAPIWQNRNQSWCGRTSSEQKSFFVPLLGLRANREKCRLRKESC